MVSFSCGLLLISVIHSNPLFVASFSETSRKFSGAQLNFRPENRWNSNLAKRLTTLLILPSLFLGTPQLSKASTLDSPVTLTQTSNSNDDVGVYFGVGCFWHVQHEFVDAEKKLLGRKDDELTSVAGYAGGSRTGKNPSNSESKGIVCYHNLQGIADYGSLGHGEVVGLNIPKDSVEDFAKQYFSLYDSDHDRPDKVMKLITKTFPN